MRIGEPALPERPHAHLDSETNQEKCEGKSRCHWPNAHQERNIRAHRVEVVFQFRHAAHERARDCKQLGANHRRRAGNFHHQEKLSSGANTLCPAMLVADQGVTRQRHHLPEDEEEPHHVSGAEQAIHRGQENQEIRVVPGHAVLVVAAHIKDGIERGWRSDQHRQKKEDGSQTVDVNAQGKAGPGMHQNVVLRSEGPRPGLCRSPSRLAPR